MIVRFWLHSVLADRTAGSAERVVEGDFASIREALQVCFHDEPRVVSGMIDERGVLRPHIAIFMDNVRVPSESALDMKPFDNCEIGCFCAVSGG